MRDGRGRAARARLAVIIVAAIAAIPATWSAGSGAATEEGTVQHEAGPVPVAVASEVTVKQYPEPVVVSAPGAAGEEGDLDEGKAPPVPRRADGVTGIGIAQPSVVLVPGAQGQASPDDLVFGAAPAVVGSSETLTSEPQVAAHGDRMLVTWNWGAAMSRDGGRSFTYLDPYTAFPSAADGFCCDQLAAYVPHRDLWIWVLQYAATPGPTGGNVLRVAYAQGDAAFDDSSFRYADLRPQDVGFLPGVWIDYPKLGWTDDALFVSTNGYTAMGEAEDAGRYLASLVWRMPFDDLASGVVGARALTTLGNLDLGGSPLFSPYPIRGSGDTMFLAAHIDQATMGVWSWSDADPGTFGFRSVTRRAENGVAALGPPADVRHRCPTTGAADPATSDWCSFSDQRITAGWRRGDRIGWAWNVPQDADWGTAYPWVYAVELDVDLLDRCLDGRCIAGYPGLAFEDRAVQYLAVAPDAQGDLGGVALAGGGRSPLTCFALRRARDAGADAGWQVLSVASSDSDSPEPRAGDYLGIAPADTVGGGWVASCMTVHRDDQRVGTRIHAARFGLRAEVAP